MECLWRIKSLKIAHLMVSWGASAELSVVYGTACSSSLEHSDATRATNPCMGAQNRDFSPRASLFGHVGS